MARSNETGHIPLSGGMRGRDQELNSGSAPSEFLFDPVVVGRHPPEKIRSPLLRVHAAYVIFPADRSSAVALIVPEVEVPPSIEVANAGTASDFHFIPLSGGIPRRWMALSARGG